jgi:hypothetical protein
MGREFPRQHRLWMTQAPKARHRVRSLSRTNKAHHPQSVGRISVSVIRHFAETAPWPLGFVGGAIRFAIAPYGHGGTLRTIRDACDYMTSEMRY